MLIAGLCSGQYKEERHFKEERIVGQGVARRIAPGPNVRP